MRGHRPLDAWGEDVGDYKRCGSERQSTRDYELFVALGENAIGAQAHERIAEALQPSTFGAREPALDAVNTAAGAAELV